MNTPALLIAADRGSLKASTVEQTCTRGPMPRLAEAFQVSAMPDRYSEKLSDEAGGFPNGVTAGQGNSIAERQTLDAELQSRAFREVARHIEDVVHHHQPKTWGFAAPSEINGAILDGLRANTKSTLKKVVNRDLIHAGAEELLLQFAAA